MSDVPWKNKTLRELGEGIGNGTIDPCEFIDYLLLKIKSDPDRDKIFLNITVESARDEARQSSIRAKNGNRLSLYDGIPLAWKDNIEIKGLPTSAGLPILAKNIAKHDAAAYRIALEAGLICIGKTNMTELAFSGLGINPSYGTPTNPFSSDIPRVPGGSSSGSAVALAKGLCCAAIGTDTGGSIRTPAAWNGLVGLKTTAKLISTKGVIPLAQTLDTVGFLTKNVADSASLYSIFTQSKEMELPDVNLKSINMFVSTSIVWDEIDPYVNDVIRKTIDAMSKSGVNIEWGLIPEIEMALDLINTHGNTVNYEGNKNWGKFLAENPGSISSDILARFQTGSKISEQSIQHVYSELEEITKQYKKRVQNYDAVIMPTVSIVPPIISELENSSDLYARENILSLRNTRLVNLLGLCAISIPVGVTKTGFPVGMMLVASPYAETKLLQLAAALEKTLKIYGCNQ